MPEQEAAAPEQQQESNEPAENSGFTPPASQDELNKIIADRITRERAKYADYGDLKSKAAKFDEIEQANKSEMDKIAERAAAAEAERDAARIEILRFRVAAKHGISDEDADLFLTGSDEESLTAQAERLASRYADAGKPRSPKPDPNQGRTSSGTASTADQFAASVGDLL
jgi:hypothetical protein